MFAVFLSTVAEEEAAAADREMARELDSKEREVKQLLSDLKELKESTAAEQAATENQIQEMEDENQEAAKRLLKMELKLEMQSDYENVKKELNILKSLEFSQHEGGDGEEQSSQVILIDGQRFHLFTYPKSLTRPFKSLLPSFLSISHIQPGFLASGATVGAEITDISDANF